MTTSLDSSSLLAIIISLIFSLVVHEFMHGYAAYLLGDRTAKDQGRLSLNPLHHIDPFMTIILPIFTLLLFKVPLLAAKPVPFNPDRVKFDEFGGAIVAAAGPLSNLAMAIIGAFILSATPGTGFLGLLLGEFVYINVALFVFNFIPIPPLDGSRVLYAFAPEGIQEFMNSIEPYGLFIVFALVLGTGSNFLQNIDQSILNLMP